MSETLRELVVSLSLNSDNFSRNIKSVNQQIKEAESAFKLAASGVKNFEGSQSGTSAKLDMLRQKQALQAKATQQYEMALQKASGKLQKGQADVQKYSTALTAQQKTHAQLKAEIDRVNAKYKEYVRTLGESDSASIAAKENLDALQAEYKASGEEITKLQGKLKSANASIQNSQDAVSKAKQGLNEAKAAMKTTGAEIARLESGWTKAGNALTAFSGKAAAAGAKMGALGRTMSRYVTAPLIALGVGAVKASIDFESAFAGVRKTVDASEDEYGRLAESIKRMSTEIATDTGTIAGVMENAGQLGIKNENLESFTRTMVDLGNSTNLAANEAATSIAQFANITGMAQGQFRNFGSSLVDLGNNFATTESDIMNMASRLAASGSQVGLTQPQILGFATALSSVGLEAEAGGTAFSKAMVQMQVAVETGGQKLNDFSRVSGLTTDQFKALWESDPAGAIESFIVGLSQMDEQGVSSIVTLEEMGLKEVRLRDTLLRATNATDLFASAQKTANAAWKENSALTNEAEKRYATTESKLKNLKNSAVLAGRQIGDDLNPMIQDAIGNASGLVDSFMALDKEQRMQIVQWAAIAAAAGPAIAILGKGVATVGKITGALGKFSTSVGSAGGGLKGLVSVIGGSKLAVAALAAAAVVGMAAWYDYASGAKAARDALASMQKTADDWKNTAADTFYGGEGLSAFGLDASSFEPAVQSSKIWLDELSKVWSDGEKETDDIVSRFSGNFAKNTDGIRSQLETLKGQAGESSVGGALVGDIDADIKKLDSLDKGVEKLLKKKQNGNLTDKDKVKLQDLIDQREAIRIKYNLEPDGGYGQILQGIQAEIAKAAASGDTVDASVYEQATKAITEGRQAYNQQLDESYRQEYALIQLLGTEEERAEALEKLNAQYNEQRKQGAQDYVKALSETAPEVLEGEGMQKAQQDMATLTDLIAQYNASQDGSEKAGILEQMNQLTEGMDEGKLTEYLALISQIKEAAGEGGLTPEETAAMFPEVPIESILGNYATIGEFLSAHKGELVPLDDMFNGAIPEEIKKITAELDMTTVEAQWTAFSSDPGAITAPVTLTGLPETPIEIPANAPTTVTELPEKITIDGESPMTLTGVPETLEINSTSPVTITGLPEGPIEIPANSPTTLTGLPEQINIAGEAAMTLTGVPEALEIKSTSPVTLTGIPTEPIEIAATLTGLPGTVTVGGSVLLTPLGAVYKAKFAKDNKITGVPAFVSDLSIDPAKKEAMLAAAKDGLLTLIGADGLPVNIGVGDVEQLYGKDLLVGSTTGADGSTQLVVQIVPKLGSPEGVEDSEQSLTERPDTGLPDWLSDPATKEKMNAIKEWQSYIDMMDEMGEVKAKGEGEIGLIGQLQNLDAKDIENLAASATNLMAALNGGELGEDDAEAAKTRLQEILDLIKLSDQYLGVGNDVSAGVAEGMTAYGWSGDASTLATSIETAIRAATQTQSPSQMTVPIGTGISEGIGEGITAFSFAAAGSSVRQSLLSALSNIDQTGRVIGRNFSRGLANGITSGESWIKEAARKAALAAKKAAEDALKVASPSKVGFEIGGYFTKGIALGVESEEQLRLIRNAARYLSGALQAETASSIQYDNRRTYQHQEDQSVTVNVEKLAVRDQVDIRALAMEISALKKQINRGKGG